MQCGLRTVQGSPSPPSVPGVQALLIPAQTLIFSFGTTSPE